MAGAAFLIQRVGDFLKIQQGPIRVDEVLEAVRRPDAGAVALFLGTVRNHHEGKRVSAVRYHCFREMAEKELAKLAREAGSRWALGGVAIVHRVGPLQIGDVSVAIAVSSSHREEAFQACRFLIDTLKRTVPIWKEEFYEQGRAWVT